MKQLLTSAVLFLCCVTTTLAQFSGTVSDSQGVKYTANNDESTCYVSGHEDNYEVTIIYPEEFEGRRVTSIGEQAFYYCSALTSVTIPNSVTSIGYAAFYGCSGLTSITIPNSVTSIGNNAFGGCSGLSSITIPNSVTNIEGAAFYGCSSLSSIAIPNSVTSIGNYAFEYCSSLTSITIPNSVTSIGNGAFKSCGLTSITIPNSVTSIGYGAFQFCSLTSITIPNSVTSIEDDTFSYCINLNSIAIPNSVTSIGKRAFIECSSLTSITIPNSVTSIEEGAFSRSGLTSITIPNSVTSIGTAFTYCSGLASINVDSGNSIYDSRDNCNAIIETASNTLICGCQNTVIPNSVTSIGDFAFWGHSGLTSIRIPNSVTRIGRVFCDCSSLTSINVDSGNSTYDSRNNCNAIIETASNTLIAGCKNTVIPNNVTSIGNYAFRNCSNLTSITIPDGVTSIGDHAFEGCSGLTSITIPNSVTSIGVYAFYYCCGLTSIRIPNSVWRIGRSAYGECRGLTSVTVEWKNPPHGDDLLNGISSLIYENTTLYVPKGTKALYEADYFADLYWNKFVAIVEMDEIVIGDEGMGTYCSTHALDFSGTDDIKAYIVSAFRPSTGEVTLTRITDVPANTGIVVKGAAGTYSIPMGSGETIVANMLRGVTTNTVLNKVEGDYTNYILAKKNGSLGFYAVVDGSTLSASKAYLPLPTASLPSGARSIKLVFEDGGTTGISEASRLNDKGEMINDNVYDLQGRRVEKPARGLYIVNGRKVVIK